MVSTIVSFGQLLIPLSAGLRLQPTGTQSAFRRRLITQPTRNSSSAASPEKTFQARLEKVNQTYEVPYPRLAEDKRTVSVAEFLSRYDHLATEESGEDSVVVSGRFVSVWPVASLYLD